MAAYGSTQCSILIAFSLISLWPKNHRHENIWEHPVEEKLMLLDLRYLEMLCAVACRAICKSEALRMLTRMTADDLWLRAC